ncbi:ankyrin repeat domain-containing protein [Lysinibacillus pakistanensis]|uniref:Ankyrin repeat domain-containing protein n=1 Tax=Lysinibacillus pakistanensis TaxID=759811 RepID=A0AAX3WYC8_9BACI|nr:ankyrin repeat domain-containing protein [Lysinibacillus pakistanensis]MDM5231067.1 ankyrin repeat domain-containing protein [Lysinibacillus pakistanensis]WHY46628.1 ankyrin repeat domain-containing protein [Lysinibacillus pakistanensis]WHY51641.1 ankyrin repeat domain-containing protein [Lysinibacillus pakistanensis]
MINLKNIGKFHELPEMAMHIYNGNVPALLLAIEGGWDIEKDIILSQYISLSPLDLSLRLQRLNVIGLLVEHGVNLNVKNNSAFLVAVRYCKEDVVRYIVKHGAKLDILNQVGSGAYSQAYYGNKKNIPLIHELGLDIRQYGGPVLRQAVSNHDMKTVTYLLDQGVDINYNKPDMVYPYQATPLTVATRMGNLTMVKYLVERGANVTLAEKDGERPYTIAVGLKNTILADYLKALEPAMLHDLENKKYEVKKYKLSDELISFLTGEELRLELDTNDYDIRYIDFFTLTDTIEMKVGRQTLLRLSAYVDNYSDLQIVWNPRKKQLGCYDVEHQEYADLCSFKEFLVNPGTYVINFLEGEL